MGSLEKNSSNGFSIRRAEARKKDLEKKLESLQKTDTDQTINFEQLGIDRIYIDEAHNYKNLYTVTKLSNISGIQIGGNKITENLYQKCQYLNEINNGKGIVFATGTPISNSVTELYTMQKYLQPELLEKQGLGCFDAWAANFGQVKQSLEIAPEGKNFKLRTRFANFNNIPELMSMFKVIADIKTADMIKLPVPEAENIVEQLVHRAEKVHSKQVLPTEDNMLNIVNDGRKLALDQRLIDPTLPDDPNSKVNICVNNVLKVYNNNADKKSTQLIFCDQSTPQEGFNVYDDIKEKLVNSGVKPEEIAFIQDAKSEEQKEKLFEKVRNGEVRILLGSTRMMGTGTNVQDKLIALHDLDIPWRPSDLEQRAGRIVRQGNENKNVKIFRYVTKGTFDAYLWQTLENKQRFISQIMTSKSPMRSIEDIDEATLDFAEIKAIAEGNPLIKEKMEVENSINRLKIAKTEYENSIRNLKYKVENVYPVESKILENKIEKVRADIETVQKSPEEFSVKLNDKIFTNQKDAVEFLNETRKKKGYLIGMRGEIKGLPFEIQLNEFHREEFILRGQFVQNKATHASSGVDNINRLVGMVENLPKTLDELKFNLDEMKNQMDSAKITIETPFPRQEEFDQLKLRAIEIDAKLNSNSEETERRLNNIFTVEPQTLCEKKFFALVKHAIDVNDHYTEHNQKLAVRDLFKAGFSQTEITETLFKNSPIVSDKEKLTNFINSFKSQVKSAGR